MADRQLLHDPLAVRTTSSDEAETLPARRGVYVVLGVLPTLLMVCVGFASLRSPKSSAIKNLTDDAITRILEGSNVTSIQAVTTTQSIMALSSINTSTLTTTGLIGTTTNIYQTTLKPFSTRTSTALSTTGTVTKIASKEKDSQEHVAGESVQYVEYKHWNCYGGHGGSYGGDGFQATQQECASHNKPCYVYFSKQRQCFLRDWCNSNATGCQYGSYGAESWDFSTYIKPGVSPPPPPPPKAHYTKYEHWNCYGGHGGSDGGDGFYATQQECESHNKPCYVYFSKQSQCFLRDWCNSNATGCAYGSYGTESWLFSTYIKNGKGVPVP